MNNALPIISIIVPVYNMEKSLDKCVNSIINQTYKNLDIILIDDGSTDNSLALCDHYKTIDNRIRVFHKENSGLSSTRNLGLDLIKGDYVGFVDSDDWIEATMYEDLLNGLLSSEADICVCGRYNVFEDKSKEEVFYLKKPILMSQKEALKSFLLSEMLDASCCDKLFKREVIEKLRFPSGFYICEDLPFICDALIKSKAVYHLGKPLYNYFQRNGSMSKSKFDNRTYGLLLYSKYVRDAAKKEYDDLNSEADYYYLIRLYWYLRIYYDQSSVKKIGTTFKCKEFNNKYISKHIKIYIFLMKIHLFRIMNWFHKKISKK